MTKKWGLYEKIGQTRDDAVGEAFDKVARMMNLPYPGGPEISKLAEIERKNPSSPPLSNPVTQLNTQSTFGGSTSEGSNVRPPKVDQEYIEINLPRPMLHTDDFDFSFSGLKTAVLYLIKNLKKDNNWEELPIKVKQKIALEFETAVTEILLKKTRTAIEKYGAKTLILGGGVIANNHIRQTFQKLSNRVTQLEILMPEIEFSTDNAVMIGIAGYFQYLEQNSKPAVGQKKKGQLQFATDLKELQADGNLSF